MGFHKRFIDLECILALYKERENLNDVKDYLNTDALIIEVNSCQHIVNKLLYGDDHGALLIIKYELSR